MLLQEFQDQILKNGGGGGGGGEVKQMGRMHSWCLGVAAIKNHTPPVFSCVVWLLSGTKK